MKKIIFFLLCIFLVLNSCLAESIQVVDLIVFAGQSNMAGRGITNELWPEEPPEVIDGAGWEFRAISDPTRLYPIQEPFGLNENNPEGINDAWGTRAAKTGSMVSAFVNAYYVECGVPVIAVSASKGGSGIAEWTGGTPYLSDLLFRLNTAKTWLDNNGYEVRHVFCVWCQGETDGDRGTPDDQYIADFNNMLNEMMAAGIEQLLMVSIGQCNAADSEDRYLNMIALQDQIASTNEHVTMVSRSFVDMRERGLMKDDFHYFQQGYNEVGIEAGKNSAKFMKQ